MISRGCGAYTVCVPCRGRGVILVEDLPAAGAGVPSMVVNRTEKGGEKEELKLKRKALALIGLLLSCSAEHASKPSEDATVPIRGHVEVDAMAAVEVGQDFGSESGPGPEVGREVSGPEAVRDSQAFEAIWELSICGDLNNQDWVIKWQGQDCTDGDAGGLGHIRLPTRGNKLLSCWGGRPVNVPLPCYMPAIGFDGGKGVMEHIRVNDCRECIQ